MEGRWFVYAVSAMTLLAIADFSLGHMNKGLRKPVSTFTLNFFAYMFMGLAGITAVLLGELGYLPKNEDEVTKKDVDMLSGDRGYAVLIIPFIALCYILGNRYLWTTYTIAPSIGVAEGIYSVNSVIVLLLTHYLFGAPIALINVVGILLSILGVLLLSGQMTL